MENMLKAAGDDFFPFIRVNKDGTVDRPLDSPIVPPSPEDPETGVTSKDVTISQDPPISARLYLPKPTTRTQGQKLPILVYFHGGGFCFESAFSLIETKLMNALVSEAKVIAISIEYRLAPENPLPIGYEDCWAGLEWVASHADDGDGKEPWIKNFGDFDRVFIGGDSAGANIVHNIAMRAGHEDLPSDVKLVGAFLTHPYFWGSKPIGSEKIEGHGLNWPLRPSWIWNFVYPSATNGIDNPMINPFVPEAPTLAGLGCRQLLICVSEFDMLKDRGIMYYDEVKGSGFEGEVELVQVDGEDHTFHILKYGSESSRNFIKRLSLFLSK